MIISSEGLTFSYERDGRYWVLHIDKSPTPLRWDPSATFTPKSLDLPVLRAEYRRAIGAIIDDMFSYLSFNDRHEIFNLTIKHIPCPF
jgi:hypothetical protein